MSDQGDGWVGVGVPTNGVVFFSCHGNGDGGSHG